MFGSSEAGVAASEMHLKRARGLLELFGSSEEAVSNALKAVAVAEAPPSFESFGDLVSGVFGV